MLLAAGEITDWIEGVVWLLIIGGSVLAGIAKPLIKKFGGEVPDEAEKRREEAPRPQPVRPAHPPARPMPARPRPQPATEVPVSEARPAQPFPPFVAKSAPPTPRRPVARPSPSRSVRAKPKVVVERDLSERHLAKLESEITERHIRIAAPSEGVTHPGTEAAYVDASLVSRVDEGLDAIRHPTRTALRRAIVMNEILGPPISLRPPDV